MATIHNALRYSSDLVRAYRRVVGMDELEEGVTRLGESLTPTLDLWGPPEFAFHRGDRISGGRFDKTSIVTEAPTVILYNPGGSQTLVILQHWQFVFLTVGAAYLVALITSATRPAGFARAASGPLDTRDPRGIVAGGASIAEVLDDSEVAGTTQTQEAFDAGFLPVNTMERLSQPVILAPGTGLIVRAEINQVQRIWGGIRWRERALLSGEERRV